MKKAFTILAGAALLLAAGAAAAVAQAPAAESSQDKGSAARSAVSLLRRSLLDLASLQEMQLSGKQKRYSSNLAELGYQAPRGVSVRVLEATADGWSGIATSNDDPGRSCVIYFGKATAPATAGGKKPTRSAAIACDD